LDSTLAAVHYDFGLLYLFSQNVPGVTSPDDQLAKAIGEFETYRSMRTAKAPKGQGGGEDVDELLSTAKRKQNELRMKSAPSTDNAPAAPSASASGNSPPAPPGSSVPSKEPQ
jgi:hypothetical protein